MSNCTVILGDGHCVLHFLGQSQFLKFSAIIRPNVLILKNNSDKSLSTKIFAHSILTQNIQIKHNYSTTMFFSNVLQEQ